MATFDNELWKMAIYIKISQIIEGKRNLLESTFFEILLKLILVAYSR